MKVGPCQLQNLTFKNSCETFVWLSAIQWLHRNVERKSTQRRQTAPDLHGHLSPFNHKKLPSYLCSDIYFPMLVWCVSTLSRVSGFSTLWQDYGEALQWRVLVWPWWHSGVLSPILTAGLHSPTLLSSSHPPVAVHTDQSLHQNVH